MVLKDTTSPGDENFDAPSPRRASPFEQSLPRTAPVPSLAEDRLKKRHKALFNVPDWRSEEEIILEAAELDSSIMVPEKLRRTKPKVIDSPSHSTTAPPSQPAETEVPAQSNTEQTHSSAAPDTPGDETVYPHSPASTAHSGTKATPSTDTHPDFNAVHRPTPTQKPIISGNSHLVSQHLQSPRVGSNRLAGFPGTRSLVELASIGTRLVGNLLVLMIPTLCVLLLSGWGPQEIAIIFDDLWLYLGLSLLVTVVLVVLDEVAQVVSAHLNIPKLLEWMIEFVLSALGAGACLFFFTHSVLGAFLLGLIVSVLTSLISHVVAKLF